MSCSVNLLIKTLRQNELTVFNHAHRATRAFEDSGLIEVQSPAFLDGTNTSEQAKQFSFDAVFSEKATQRKIYDTCAAPVVQSVLEGYNGTIFAYGQTGAGKVSILT